MKKETKKKKDFVTPQFRHIKELAQLKYDAEEKREQALIQQSSQMQTGFSFLTAAVFMALPICIEYRGPVPIKLFFVSISIIALMLMGSLVLASLAQWRWKTLTFPDISEIKKSIVNSPEWEKFLIESHRLDQWVGIVETIQSERTRLNNRRVKLIIASMICFYGSLASILISFLVVVMYLI